MITQKTIDEILSINIADFIGKEIVLKKSGANYQGNCPFHDEKTASFVVSPSKGIYKCFGCGQGGNIISFAMEHRRLDFVEAVKHIAKETNITIEETVEREDKEIREKRLTMLDINKAASKKYVEAFLDLPSDHLAAKTLISHRRLSLDSIIDFQIGYAPERWDFLSKKIVDTGLYSLAEELGLIGKNDLARVYDVFRNRLMFPIQNERGDIIAFSGRKLDDNKKDNPKYINSKESMLYRKSEVLFGLFQAQKTIRKLDHAIIVEGNIDVIMMHQAGLTNTVATCGTALTESHAQKLARYCSRVTLMMDGDEAGRKATLKAIDILLMAGLAVSVVNLEKGWDPDSLIQRDFPESLPKLIL